MRTPEQVNGLIEALENEYPPECSLQYEKDYELLFAVRLAAQCTDERVDKITPLLYEKYPDVQSLAAAQPEGFILPRSKKRWSKNLKAR